MNKFENKKILFIGPKFFNYHETIIENLIQQKNEVTFIPEEENSKFEWAISKVSPVLVRYYLNTLIRRKISKLESIFNVIFLIHGQWIEPRIIENLKIQNPKAKFIMYQWDSTISNLNILKISGFFDKIFSFDHSDCTKYDNFIYLPLFFSNNNFKNLLSTSIDKYDLLFVGKWYPDRIKILEKIKAENNSLKTKILILISPFRYFIEKILLRGINYLQREEFIFKQISYNDFLFLILNSTAVIDIEHPLQTGLTIITFEVLSMGKKLITTNHFIKKEPFYDDQIIAVIDRQNPKIPDDFLKNKNEKIVDFDEYSIERWLNKIFETNL
jgi:hypothetical protein